MSQIPHFPSFVNQPLIFNTQKPNSHSFENLLINKDNANNLNLNFQTTNNLANNKKITRLIGSQINQQQINQKGFDPYHRSNTKTQNIFKDINQEYNISKNSNWKQSQISNQNSIIGSINLIDKFITNKSSNNQNLLNLSNPIEINKSGQLFPLNIDSTNIIQKSFNTYQINNNSHLQNINNTANQGFLDLWKKQQEIYIKDEIDKRIVQKKKFKRPSISNNLNIYANDNNENLTERKTYDLNLYAQGNNYNYQNPTNRIFMHQTQQQNIFVGGNQQIPQIDSLFLTSSQNPNKNINMVNRGNLHSLNTLGNLQSPSTLSIQTIGKADMRMNTIQAFRSIGQQEINNNTNVLSGQTLNNQSLFPRQQQLTLKTTNMTDMIPQNGIHQEILNSGQSELSTYLNNNQSVLNRENISQRVQNLTERKTYDLNLYAQGNNYNYQNPTNRIFMHQTQQQNIFVGGNQQIPQIDSLFLTSSQNPNKNINMVNRGNLHSLNTLGNLQSPSTLSIQTIGKADMRMNTIQAFRSIGQQEINNNTNVLSGQTLNNQSLFPRQQQLTLKTTNMTDMIPQNGIHQEILNSGQSELSTYLNNPFNKYSNRKVEVLKPKNSTLKKNNAEYLTLKKVHKEQLRNVNQLNNSKLKQTNNFSHQLKIPQYPTQNMNNDTIQLSNFNTCNTNSIDNINFITNQYLNQQFQQFQNNQFNQKNSNTQFIPNNQILDYNNMSALIRPRYTCPQNPTLQQLAAGFFTNPVIYTFDDFLRQICRNNQIQKQIVENKKKQNHYKQCNRWNLQKKSKNRKLLRRQSSQQVFQNSNLKYLENKFNQFQNKRKKIKKIQKFLIPRPEIQPVPSWISKYQKRSYSQKQQLADIEQVPKCTKFVLQPSLVCLARISCDKLSCIKNLIISNKFGSIQFLTPINLLNINIDQIIKIEQDSIQILDENKLSTQKKMSYILTFQNFENFSKSVRNDPNIPIQQKKQALLSKMNKWIKSYKMTLIKFDQETSTLKVKLS